MPQDMPPIGGYGAVQYKVGGFLKLFSVVMRLRSLGKRGGAIWAAMTKRRRATVATTASLG